MATLGNPVSNQTLMSNINVDQVAVQNVPGTTLTGLANASFTTGASNTTLANVGGLSVNLAIGTYLIEGYLVTVANATAGLKLALTTTGTVSTLVTDTWSYNTATLTAEQNASAMGTIYNAAGAVTVVEIGGVIVVTAPGVVQMQAAQSVSNGTACTIANNSYFCFTRVV